MTKTNEIKRVTVGVPYRAYAIPQADEPPKEFWGDYTKKGNVWWRHVSIDVSLNWSSVPAAITALTEASTGLVDTSLDISDYEEYGSRVISTRVTGQRLATKDEHVWILRQIETDAQKREQSEQAEIERFRQKHPDLLK